MLGGIPRSGLAGCPQTEEEGVPLSDRTVKTAKPSSKPVRLWDSGGLYLEVSPAGGKLWRLKYRFGKREKRLALGIYPDVGLADARDKRDDARRVLARGVDPGAVARAVKEARGGGGTFEAIAREWHVKQSTTEGARKWSASHAKITLERLSNNVFPYVKEKKPEDVDATEWLRVLRRVEERGAVETAHRIRSICSQVYRYAVSTGRAARDPLTDLRGALAPAPDKHFASITDADKLRPVLKAIDAYQGTHVVRVALALAPILFVRPGELRSMRWADVDDAAAEWRFVASKTKTPHIVPLSKQALAHLAELKPLTGEGEFVFPSARTVKRCMSNNAINAALRRSNIDTRTEITGHGWRAAARTILEERLGFRPEVIELQLAHAVRDPLGRAYNRTTHLEERVRMMQAWADFLDGLRQENVVVGHFRRKA